MNNLEKAQTTEAINSIEVANMIGKEHNKLMRDIRKYIGQLGEAKIGHTDFSTKRHIFQSKTKNYPVSM